MLLSKLALALLISASRTSADVDLLTDINRISRSWGQISVYADNDESFFGIEYAGLPDGCQIVSHYISRTI